MRKRGGRHGRPGRAGPGRVGSGRDGHVNSQPTPFQTRPGNNSRSGIPLTPARHSALIFVRARLVSQGFLGSLLGPFWSLLGPAGGQLGAILGPLEAILKPLGAILEPYWGHIVAILGPY